MTTILNENHDPHAERYWSDLESALMAQAIASTSDLPKERIKALRRVWLVGSFNAGAHGIEKGFTGAGTLEWGTNGDELALLYRAPYGLICPLARVYPQSNGTWAALVTAGVRDDQFAAMAAAEWAVSRLTG